MNDDTGCYLDVPTAMETWTSRRYDLDRPRQQEVCVADVAHALSLICRFGGHCSRFYSVAEHSIHCHDEAVRLVKGRGLLSFLCLIHDAGEAYTNDIGRPMKMSALMDGYCRLANQVQQCVYRDLLGRSMFGAGTDWEMLLPVVKMVDNSVLRCETRRLMRSGGEGWGNLDKVEPARVTWWSWWWNTGPGKAESGFLRRLALYGVRC